jgi:hypothetical protein
MSSKSTKKRKVCETLPRGALSSTDHEKDLKPFLCFRTLYQGTFPKRQILHPRGRVEECRLVALGRYLTR